MGKTHYVHCIEKKTKKVVHQIECSNERSAERVLRGMSINLNHDEFRLKISETSSPDCEVSR